MTDNSDERPPLFGWTSWYSILLGVLIIQIIVYYIITAAYS